MGLEVAVLQNIENVFLYKSLFEIVSFALIPMWKMTPMLHFLLFDVEGGKATLHNYCLMDDMTMLWISR